jgi:hypothetical protein
VPAKKTHMQGGTFPWFTQEIPVPLYSTYAIGTEWEFSSEPTCKTRLRMMERQIADVALRMTLDPITAALLQAREHQARLEMSLHRDVPVVVNAIHAGNVPEEDMPAVLQTFWEPRSRAGQDRTSHRHAGGTPGRRGSGVVRHRQPTAANRRSDQKLMEPTTAIDESEPPVPEAPAERGDGTP